MIKVVFTLVRLVVRGGVESPTFRFSGLRTIVQGWPYWSFALLGSGGGP
jgi:hypothetical protein